MLFFAFFGAANKESLFFLCFQSNVDASYAKLALFYDWLFFDPDKESIMNIGEACCNKFSDCKNLVCKKLVV